MTTADATAGTSENAVDGDAFVERVRNYAEDELRPRALITDREGVDGARIDELAALGLLNHLAPAQYGGATLGRAHDRQVHEIISGACFNTWLVWAQHAPLAGKIAEQVRREGGVGELAQRVLRGELLLGAGVSDVRRYPHHYIAARRVPGGWVFDGTISWVSGWGLNAALTVAAVEPESENVVTALVPVGERTRSAGPLALGAVAGSRTARVRIDEVFVPDDQVLTVQPLPESRRLDQGVAADARGQHFGLAETVLRELEATPDPQAREVAAVWRPRIDALRRTAYQLSDEAVAAGATPHRIPERLQTKIAVGEALSTVTRALLITRAGRGLAEDDTAQLHARCALFVLVQGQNSDVRRAQLTELAR